MVNNLNDFQQPHSKAAFGNNSFFLYFYWSKKTLRSPLFMLYYFSGTSVTDLVKPRRAYLESPENVISFPKSQFFTYEPLLHTNHSFYKAVILTCLIVSYAAVFSGVTQRRRLRVLKIKIIWLITKFHAQKFLCFQATPVWSVVPDIGLKGFRAFEKPTQGLTKSTRLFQLPNDRTVI